MDYLGLLEHVMRSGDKIISRGEECRESMNLNLEICDANIYSFPAVRPVEKILSYAHQELAWYLSCDRDASYIQDKAKLWDKIKNKDNSLNSQYGYLVFRQKTAHPSLGDITMTGFDWARYVLERDKNSRRAVITFNNGGYNYESGDYLCTQHMAFFIRKEFLNCNIALRSSDLIYGQPYNQIFWSIVHQQMFLKILEKYGSLKLGKILVNIYSAHIYRKHYDLVEGMLKSRCEKFFLRLNSEIPIGMDISYYTNNLYNFVELRKCLS